MPKEEIEKQLRETNKHAKETGRTLSKAKKSLMKFSIFIANIPRALDIIQRSHRHSLSLTLGDRIKLIFKQWKSKLNVHYLKGTNKNRIDCLIWARLCMVIIASMLIAEHL